MRLGCICTGLYCWQIVYDRKVGFKDGKFDGDKVGVMEGFFDTSFHLVVGRAVDAMMRG